MKVLLGRIAVVCPYADMTWLVCLAARPKSGILLLVGQIVNRLTD